MTHLYVKDIQAGQQIQDTYMVTQPILRNTTKGDLYIAMFLSDKTGKVNSRMWQATEQIYQALGNLRTAPSGTGGSRRGSICPRQAAGCMRPVGRLLARVDSW